MKKIILAVCLAMVTMGINAQEVVGVSVKANNQNTNRGGTSQKSDKATQKQQQTAEEIYKESAEAWVETLGLGVEDGTKFTDLYMEWQHNRMNITDKYGFTAKAGDDVNFKKISADEADKMMQDEFARQQKQAEVDRDYYSKFQQYATAGQAAQIVMQKRNSAAGMSTMFKNMKGGRGMRGMMF